MRKILLVIMAMVMCFAATGCMGAKKDITKEDAEKYNAVVAEACEEYGYEYEEETVLPKGSELLYSLTKGEEDVLIEVNIDEESVSGKVECQFDIKCEITNPDEVGTGIEPHLDVLVKIAEYFTEDITKEALASYLYDEELWEPGTGDDEYLLIKAETGNASHSIAVLEGTAAEYEEEDPLEEHFVFWWDNGKTYKLKQDK